MAVNTTLTRQQALSKLQRYCAYQERCARDVILKLNELEVHEKLHEKILADLKKENFLNEKRFAKSFVRGKFNLKKWGRVKIENELQQRNIPEKLIKEALQEIDHSEYRQTLKKLLKHHPAKVLNNDPFIRNQKMVKSLASKGFEPELIWELLNKKRR